MSDQTHDHFTGSRNKAVEQQLREALPSIGESIGQLKLSYLAGVYLGGGYGRGEGGVYVNEEGKARLYNDLDFFVLTEGASKKQCVELSHQLRLIEEDWTKRLEVEVEFGPAKELKDLPRMSNTLMYQELKHGHFQVYGPSGLLKVLPEVSPENLPYMEGIRLLLNRGMGLLFAGEHLAEHSDDTSFIVRNLNKAVLGSADSLLLTQGRYRWTLEERIDEFAKLAGELGMQSEASEMYRRACEFKYHPHSRMPETPWSAWQEVRTLWRDAVVKTVGAADASAASVKAALHQACVKHGGRSLLNVARRLVRAHEFSLNIDAPVATLLGELYEIVTSPTDTARGAYPVRSRHVYSHWLVFN